MLSTTKHHDYHYQDDDDDNDEHEDEDEDEGEDEDDDDDDPLFPLTYDLLPKYIHTTLLPTPYSTPYILSPTDDLLPTSRSLRLKGGGLCPASCVPCARAQWVQ